MDQQHRILVIDDAWQRKWETVAYTCQDTRGEIVYVTREGLQYIRDSLRRKRQYTVLDRLDAIPGILAYPDIVIWDPDRETLDTLLYYRRLYFPAAQRYGLVCAVVKVRENVKFLYNLFRQQSEKVKGHGIVPGSAFRIWYIHPQKRPKQFGIKP